MEMFFFKLFISILSAGLGPILIQHQLIESGCIKQGLRKKEHQKVKVGKECFIIASGVSVLVM
jgi:hypothetical protein